MSSSGQARTGFQKTCRGFDLIFFGQKCNFSPSAAVQTDTHLCGLVQLFLFESLQRHHIVKTQTLHHLEKTLVIICSNLRHLFFCLFIKVMQFKKEDSVLSLSCWVRLGLGCWFLCPGRLCGDWWPTDTVSQCTTPCLTQDYNHLICDIIL